ncbi:hypothetical protein SAMN04487867_104100 [Vreelandella titanicae]|uniref:hypothetical protein n=1 Tax=Vreelandella titanicae TaxID=664683 RepID=UPI0008872F45|nr:hypothetical protein [Halomonas titanicae]SDI28619.1 hypothetical protein SAMN04487867_104100 [Halomonas titanicae]
MTALTHLHQLADQCRECGFFVSVSTAYHPGGNLYVSVMIFSSGVQIEHLYGNTPQEVAEPLAAFNAANKQEAA